jgi:polar amino acid transport system substrate-binding protein
MPRAILKAEVAMSRLHIRANTARRCAAFMLFSMTASSAVHAQTRQQATVLDIAVEDEADMWSRNDGSGYANEIVRAAFSAVGIDARLRVMPYARCKTVVAEGAMVACLSMSADPQLAGVVKFSSMPLFVCDADFIESREQPLKAKRAEDLPRGTVVGVVNGYEYPPSIRKLEHDGIIVLDYSASETINLRKLIARRLDAAIVNLNEVKTLEYVASTAGVSGKVRSAFSAGELKSHIGFSHKHPEGLWALERFNKGAAIISSNGTLARIHDKWARLVAESVAAAPHD